MSQASEIANAATTFDWKLIAAAAATFLATLTISILGWLQGRKKLEKRIEASVGDGPVTGAVLLDNLTLREATIVNREVRDHLLIHCEALKANTKALSDHTDSMDDFLEEVKKLRQDLKQG